MFHFAGFVSGLTIAGYGFKNSDVQAGIIGIGILFWICVSALKSLYNGDKVV